MDIRDRLNVAFVADTFHSNSGGGILSGEYVVNQLRRDHMVVTVGTDGDDALPSFQLPLRAMQKSGFVMARPDRSVLAHAFAKVDLVHLQFPFWLSFAALDEARKLGLPIVAGFHVQPENALFSVGVRSEWLNERIYRTLVNRFYNKVDGVICPTPFAAEKLKSHGLTAPTFVISNGVPPDVAQAMAGHTDTAPRSPDARFLILAVGRLAAEKRQDVVIEAVRLSRHRDQIRLVLSGAGPREAELRALASALPNGAEFGFLSRETLLDNHLTIKASVAFWWTKVETRSRTLAADAYHGAARGEVRGGDVVWSTPVTGYHSDGSIDCEGNVCGKYGAPPPGASELHEASEDVVFQPFHFAPDGKTFTMGFSKVSHSESPKQTTLVGLSGRETKRVCVSNVPASS